MTVKSEADGDSAAVDIPDIDHRHSLRTAATITAATFGHETNAVQSLLSFQLLSDVPGAGTSTDRRAGYRSDATFFERRHDKAMIDLARRKWQARSDAAVSGHVLGTEQRA